MGMRGAMSVSAFGRLPAKSGFPGGQFGIFASALAGPTARSVNKYSFATDVVSAGTQLTTQVTSSSRTGAGIITKAVICVGGTTASTEFKTDVYNYAIDATSNGGALSATITAGAAACNATSMLISVGSNLKTLMIYDFPSDTAVVTTSLVTNATSVGMAGNSSFVIAATGGPSPGVKTTNKFSWVDGSTGLATALASNYGVGTAISNSSYGLFFGSTTTTQKYIWSGETTVNSTTSPISFTGGGAAIGNDTNAVYINGLSNTQTYKYQYADDSIVGGGLLTQGVNGGAAASQGITGVSI